MPTERDIEQAYWQGQRDATQYAIKTLERGLWWHLRDDVARALHWLAIRIEPKE
jgi:hypothetical protein